MATKQKSVLITGCSPGGIGHALAREFRSKGLRVFATARNKASLVDLLPLGIDTLSLEVTNIESIRSAKAEISQATGGTLDYLVNNAGRNYTVPALDVEIDEIRQTFETNLFAVMRVTQELAPLLIEAKGTIVNIGSVAGIIPYIFGSTYNASKAALHSYSDTLRIELAPFDVKVVVVVTGGVQSRIARTERQLPPGSLYIPIDDAYQNRLVHSQHRSMPNEVYARGVVNKVLKRHPPKHLWRGRMAVAVWFVTTFIGKWYFDWVFPRMFGLNRLAKIVKAQKKTA
jgi:1-acylglycerone phosphate reductase